MRYGEKENGVGVWSCVCGHTEGDIADPRHAPPAANVRVFEDDDRQAKPI